MISLHARQEEILSQAISRKRVASAYLFLGPEGAGKFSFALRFAQALDCENGNFPPCGHCHGCTQIQALTHPDLHILALEEDDKQIKIDAVRAFQERLSYRAFQGGWKIGIVREAEHLNLHAMNALLKTLEEPTPDTIMVLTCGNRSRLLPTVVSRCQTLRFPPVPVEQLTEILGRDKKMSREKALLIANLAEGNLEKLSDIEHSMEQRKKFLAHWLELSSANPGDIFDLVGDRSFAKNLPHYLKFIIDWHRDLIRVKLNRGPEFNPDFEMEIKNQARKYTMKQLVSALETLLSVEDEIASVNLNAQTAGEKIFLQLR
jgi:DNA polymerase III subunit delta'